MHNFPLPYPGELIYSVIARAGVHHGILSPKSLLDEVFGNRHVISTVDLPNQLSQVLRWLPPGDAYSIEDLVYKHTLFPLYAPFSSEEHRLDCLKKMETDSQGSIHLILGVAASRLKQPRYLRYCPECWKQQTETFGECYWVRDWQVAGFENCEWHGPLLESDTERHSPHRHQFFSAEPYKTDRRVRQSAKPEDQRLSRQITELLNRGPHQSPTLSQWSTFYHALAAAKGCGRGKQVHQDRIREHIEAHWSPALLSRYRFSVCPECSWTQAIFRKHRKSVSYLEHIIVLDTFLDDDWHIGDVLDEVASILTSGSSPNPSIEMEVQKDRKVQRRRACWRTALACSSVKAARRQHGALYAWLYRHDKSWLLAINLETLQPRTKKNQRINWALRSFEICRKLISIRRQYSDKHAAFRRSRHWYLSMLANAAMIEKNLDKMASVRAFFDRYCESVSDYQARRLFNAAERLNALGKPVVQWRLLRIAGLSDERLTKKARSVLHDVVGNGWP